MQQINETVQIIPIQRRPIRQSIRLNITIFFLVPIITRCFSNNLPILGWFFIVLGILFVISVYASRMSSLNYLQISGDGISVRTGIRLPQTFRWEDIVTKVQTFQIPGVEAVCIGFDWSEKYQASLGVLAPGSLKTDLGYHAVIMEEFDGYSIDEVAALINQHRESFSKHAKSYDNVLPPRSNGPLSPPLRLFG